MEYLPKAFDRIVKESSNVQTWINTKEIALAQQVNNITAPAWNWITGVAIFIASLIFLVSVYAWIAPPNIGFPQDYWKPWPTAGTVDIYVGLFGLVVWIIAGLSAKSKTILLQEEKRVELQTNLDQNPLYPRAKLITKAIHDYQRHLDKYRSWFHAVVDDEITEADEETAERYFYFLTHSKEMLEKAVRNFKNAATLLERQEKYHQQHPDLTTPSTDTALSELLALLDEPVEFPPDVDFGNPHLALDHEEVLTALSRDLSGETLTRRIEEATAQATTREEVDVEVPNETATISR